MKHLSLWIWLKTQGLKQRDVVDALLVEGKHPTPSFISRRIRHEGFTPEEQRDILAWARQVRPRANTKPHDLFDQKAA